MSNEREKLAREWEENLNTAWQTEYVRAARDHILATTPEPTMADVEWDDEKHYLAGATSEIDSSECVMIAPLKGLIVNAKPGADRVSLMSPSALTPNGKRYELREVTDKPENPVEPSTKTMDEYTLSERTDMVGMWAGYNRHRLGGKPTDFVIITGEENEAGRVPCYNPGAPAPHDWAADIWMLTPRFDMPRAWSTDGDPCAPTVSANENIGPDQPEHPETLRTVEDYVDAPAGTVVEGRGKLPWTRLEYVWKETSGGVESDAGMAGTSRKVLRWGWGE